MSTDRNEIFEAMTPETKKVAIKNDKELQKANAGSLKTYYSLGRDVLIMHKAEQTYGSAFMNQLAEYWGITEQTLGEYKNTAEVFDWATIETAAAAGQKKGFRLEISHVNCAAKLDTADKRKEMLTRIIDEKLSYRHAKLIVDTSGAVPQRAPGGGRKQTAPKTPQQGLKKAAKVAKTLENLLDMFEEHVFSKLDVIPPEDIVKGDLALLQEFDEQIEKLGAQMDAVMILAKDRKARIEKILSNKKKVSKSAKDEDTYELEEEEEDEDETEFADAGDGDPMMEDEDEDEDDEDEDEIEFDDDLEEEEEDVNAAEEDDEDSMSMAEWKKLQAAKAKPKGKTSKIIRPQRLF